MAITLRARARELILIDRDRARAKAVAIDMHYGVPLLPLVRVADGDYSDLAGAGLAIIAAGVNETRRRSGAQRRTGGVPRRLAHRALRRDAVTPERGRAGRSRGRALARNVPGRGARPRA
jgi:hypothetical protein